MGRATAIQANRARQPRKVYSCTYTVYAEELDGAGSVTVVFSSPIDTAKVDEFNEQMFRTLEAYFGPDAEVTLPTQTRPVFD